MKLLDKCLALSAWMATRNLRQKLFLSFGFGALETLALPPIGLVPVLWAVFPVLVLLLRQAATRRQAFAIGWAHAFGYFAFGLYWMSAAMFVDIGHFWWAVPLSLFSLPAFLALFYGAAALLAWRLGVAGITGALTVALTWFLADYARGHVLTGLPWNLIGYTWDWVLPVMQTASVVGVYGLTLITLVLAVLPAAVSTNKKHNFLVWSGGILLIAVMAIGGDVRLMTTPLENVPNVRLRLVQPNVDQANKWKAGQQQANLETLLNFTAAPSDKPITDVIWPESATGYNLIDDNVMRAGVASVLPRGATLLTGLIRYEQTADETHYYNSFVVIDGKGGIPAIYDKSHLVPFGEYVPFNSVLNVRALASMGADFSAGAGPRTLRIESLPPFSPLICYEAIFPGAVVDAHDRPNLMINITNDGWYRITAGPHQHFAIVRMRAVEEGVPLIRAANTGISGVVDPLGHVTASLGLGHKGYVDADLPGALPPTFYAKYRDFPVWLIFGGVAAIIFWNRQRRV